MSETNADEAIALAIVADAHTGDILARALLAVTEKAKADEAAWRQTLQSAHAALRMIREAVEQIGPVGALPSEEGLLAGPEIAHEAEAIVDAILSLSAPGAQFRAGMEASANICDEKADELAQLPDYMLPGFGIKVAAAIALSIRAAIATVPAEADPAHAVAMPALRWVSNLCYLGNIYVGSVGNWGYRPGLWRGWVMTSEDGYSVGWFPSESEARLAVEAIVRKELGVGDGWFYRRFWQKIY